jgi:hypothetical protein
MFPSPSLSPADERLQPGLAAYGRCVGIFMGGGGIPDAGCNAELRGEAALPNLRQ